MSKKLFNFKKDSTEVKEVLRLTSKILKLLFIVMLVIIILSVSYLIKEWRLLKFFFSCLKIISPLFIGYIIAWLFNPLVMSLTQKGLNRVISSVIVYACFLLFIYLFFSILIPIIYKELLEFLSKMPYFLNKGEDVINNIFSKIDKNLFDIDNIKGNIINSMQSYGTNIMNNLPNFIVSSLGSIFSGIGTFGLSIILGFYILFDFGKVKEHLIKILPAKFQYEISHFVNTVGIELRKTVNGTFFVAFLVFVGATIGFIIIGLESPLLFGFLCGLTDLIPFIGPLIGGMVAVIVGFSQSTITGILALIIVFVIQQLENNVIQPIVMAKSTKLHPVTIILGLLIFAHFFGIIGMMFATPILSFMKILWRFIVAKFDISGYDYKELINSDEV